MLPGAAILSCTRTQTQPDARAILSLSTALMRLVCAGSYEFTVTCYMLELYNDQLIDLLADKKKGETPPPLAIKLVIARLAHCVWALFSPLPHAFHREFSESSQLRGSLGASS
jgi:hypothetical protein